MNEKESKLFNYISLFNLAIFFSCKCVCTRGDIESIISIFHFQQSFENIKQICSLIKKNVQPPTSTKNYNDNRMFVEKWTRLFLQEYKNWTIVYNVLFIPIRNSYQKKLYKTRVFTAKYVCKNSFSSVKKKSPIFPQLVAN